VVLPLPNCPDALSPQHLAAPLAKSAHEWFPPAAIATAVMNPLTTTGVDASVVVPFPNSPFPLLPQHFAVPLAKSAHAWFPPALIVNGGVQATHHHRR